MKRRGSFFDAIPVLARKCQTLIDVGLSYIRLGKVQRLYQVGKHNGLNWPVNYPNGIRVIRLYILDEPTTGLHFHDTKQLLAVLFRLREQGNTIVIIEHNLDVIKTADWIIDLGPEGGSKGGQIIATGTPEMVAKCSFLYGAIFRSFAVEIKKRNLKH